MQRSVLRLLIFIVSAVLILSCSASDNRSAKSSSLIRNLMNTPFEHVDGASQKLWEGEIGGTWVTYFRTYDSDASGDVIVVTKDQLPTSYRCTEYVDDDGDTNLDKVNIRMYKHGVGWSNVHISSDNQSVLHHANTQYNKLVGEINYKRRGYPGLK